MPNLTGMLGCGVMFLNENSFSATTRG